MVAYFSPKTFASFMAPSPSMRPSAQRPRAVRRDSPQLLVPSGGQIQEHKLRILWEAHTLVRKFTLGKYEPRIGQARPRCEHQTGLPCIAGSLSTANCDFDSTHLNFEFPFWMESSQTDSGKVVRRKWANLPFHVETASTAAS